MYAIVIAPNPVSENFVPICFGRGLPMAASAVLTFTTPDLAENGKIIWAYATYTLMMLFYTVLSTPYSALSGVMTARSQERTTLISIRFLFAFTCGALVNKYTLPLVEFFGNGNDVAGWQLTMALYGLVAAGLFLSRSSPQKSAFCHAHPKKPIRLMT
ncbi:MAG: MFS transporter [Calditrichia bacterium]